MKDLSRIQRDYKLDGSGKKIYEGHKRYFVIHGKKNPRRYYGKLKTCSVCGEKYFITNRDIKRRKGYGIKGPRCCHRCNRKYRNNHQGFLQFWVGYRIRTKLGYIMVYVPDHPFCNTHGLIFEHRLVMEEYLGRYLTKKERIHHKGVKYPINSVENKQDNRIENLMLFENTEAHLTFHRLLKKVQKIIFSIINGDGWIQDAPCFVTS